MFGLATCREYWDSMGFPEIGDPLLQQFIGNFILESRVVWVPNFTREGRHVGRLEVAGRRAFSQDVLKYKTGWWFGTFLILPHV